MLPVNNAAISLDSAIPILPNSAAYTAFLERSFNLLLYYRRVYSILLFNSDIIVIIIIANLIVFHSQYIVYC